MVDSLHPQRPESIPAARAIVDRRAVADRLANAAGGKRLAAAAREILADALARGREELARRLTEEPGNGRAAAQATSFLYDQIVRLTWDFVGERLLAGRQPDVALVALGGTGRGE